MKRKEEIMQCIIIYELIHKRRSAISHIRKGLSALGVQAAMKSNPLPWRSFFVYEETPLTFSKSASSLVVMFNFLLCKFALGYNSS